MGQHLLRWKSLFSLGKTSMQSKAKIRFCNQLQSHISTLRKQSLSSKITTLAQSRFARDLLKLAVELIEKPSSPDTHSTLVGLAWSTRPQGQTSNKCYSCFATVSDQAGDPHEEVLPGCCGCVWFLHTLLGLQVNTWLNFQCLASYDLYCLICQTRVIYRIN